MNAATALARWIEESGRTDDEVAEAAMQGGHYIHSSTVWQLRTNAPQRGLELPTWRIVHALAIGLNQHPAAVVAAFTERAGEAPEGYADLVRDALATRTRRRPRKGA